MDALECETMNIKVRFAGTYFNRTWWVKHTFRERKEKIDSWLQNISMIYHLAKILNSLFNIHKMKIVSRKYNKALYWKNNLSSHMQSKYTCVFRD